MVGAHEDVGRFAPNIPEAPWGMGEKVFSCVERGAHCCYIFGVWGKEFLVAVREEEANTEALAER